MYLAAWQGLGVKELFGTSRKRPLPFPLTDGRNAYFHTARSGIYYLFRELVRNGRSVVLVPDYHMGNEVRAIRAAGARIVWYPTSRRFEIDIETLRQFCRQHSVDVLFVIHYAGWAQPIDALRSLCDEYGLLLVEDCAMALLTEVAGRPVGTFGDYAIFCLYKTLPLPDGAVLVQNESSLEKLTNLSLRKIGRVFVAGRVAELFLERFRSSHPQIGRRLVAVKQRVGGLLTRLRVERVPVGDTGFDPVNINIGMAPFSRKLLTRLDYTAIKNRRRENFHMLKQELFPVVRTDLPAGVCPLFFPLLVQNKPMAARALHSRGVMATELWNEGDISMRPHEGEESRFLRQHVLELPIHQDITPQHIEYMVRQVKELGITLPCEPISWPQLQTA